MEVDLPDQKTCPACSNSDPGITWHCTRDAGCLKVAPVPPATDGLDLNALEALGKTITPGPWSTGGTYKSKLNSPSGSLGDFYYTPENARFIAALRNAAPALIAAARERDALSARVAELERERDEVSAELETQIETLGLIRASELRDLKQIRAERDALKAERDSARQDWADREADTMRLGVQLEDAARHISDLNGLNGREASLRIKTEGKLAEVRVENANLSSALAKAGEAMKPFQSGGWGAIKAHLAIAGHKDEAAQITRWQVGADDAIAAIRATGVELP